MSGAAGKSTPAALADWLKDPLNPKLLRAALQWLLAEVEAQHLGYRRVLPRGKEYFPAPLVGHVLGQMRDACPKAFSALHIIGQDAGGSGPAACRVVRRTLWLPRYAPELRESPPTARAGTRGGREEAAATDDLGPWAPRYARDPDALVARYVTALALGVAVSFAPRELLLDFMSAEAREGWGPLIDAAVHLNGGPLMRAFVEQVRSRAARFDARGLGYPRPVQVSPNDCERWASAARVTPFRVLGVDFGGTSVKWALYEVGGGPDRGGAVFSQPVVHPWSWHEVQARAQRENDLVGAVFTALREVCRSTGVDAVGISLAAPVKDGLPVGPSRVFGRLAAPLGISDANPLEIHRLDLAARVREVFEAPTLPVVVLNDGEADVRDSAGQIGHGGSGLSVLLKEGSGVAFAVYVDGKACDLLAETSKAILDIRHDIEQTDGPENRYPAGTIGDYCSKRGLGSLLTETPADPDAGASAGAPDDTLSQDIGRLLGSLLPGSPGYRDDRVWSDKVDASTSGRLQKIWRGLPPEYGSAVEALYEDVAATHRERQRLDLEDQLRRVAASLPKDEGKRGGTEEIVARLTDLVSHRPWRGKPGAAAVTDNEKGAVACAWVLGRWLADAVALVWEIYGAREVRLAGGPLSAKTGLFIARSAEVALQEVYGFDLDPERTPGRGEGPTLEPVPVAAHRIREAKRLRLVYPFEEGEQAGPRGAAKAALDVYLAGLKQAQLRACRDLVADDAPGDGLPLSEPFRAAEIRSRGEKCWAEGQGPWLVTDAEVEAMLASESSALGLTRVQEGQFKKW